MRKIAKFERFSPQPATAPGTVPTPAPTAPPRPVEPARPPGHPDKDKIKQPETPTVPKARRKAFAPQPATAPETVPTPAPTAPPRPVEPVRPPGHPDKDKIKQPETPTVPKARKPRGGGDMNLSTIVKFEAFASELDAPTKVPPKPVPPAMPAVSKSAAQVSEMDVAKRFIGEMAKKGLSVKKLIKDK